MNPFEMVVAIVVIGCIAGTINNWISSRAKRNEGRPDDVPAAVHQAELDRLEKRIQVLEKIVTDRHYDLKRELHELES